jgi:hypothetical protein
LARCNLDVSHPKFLASVGNDPELLAGLTRLRDLVAKDHTLSGFFRQPMKGYIDYQNKIWKWDFRPDGATSSTRKGWRLYAYVPDPNAPEPIPAIPFFFYSKADDPGGNYADHVAKAIKKFLVEHVEIRVEEDRFRHQNHSDGRTISLCMKCGETVAMSIDLEEVEIFESTHECCGQDLSGGH